MEEGGLAELGFATELLVGELVTNAIRYGSEPIHVRLLRARSLICEVSDGSSTSPHLRRAAGTDEGGRGLFLVAQIAARWGTRYTPTGKVIWTEQALTDGEEPATGRLPTTWCGDAGRCAPRDGWTRDERAGGVPGRGR